MGEVQTDLHPLLRSSHRAASPDGSLVAQINPAWEVSMGNPTSGILCVSNGLHVDRCNPCFLWSDDSKFLAVPRFFDKLRLFRRQQLLLIDFERKTAFASNAWAYYYQPESFTGGRLVATRNPFGFKRQIEYRIPEDLSKYFMRDVWVRWPEKSALA